MLDLFCGTGALAIEALSRGRRRRDAGRHATPRWPQRNVAELGLGDRCEVVRSDALALPAAHARRAFDLIFCDPPYRLADRLEGELDSLIGARLAQGGRLIVESAVRAAAAPRPAARHERRYGDTLIRDPHRRRDDEQRRASRSARAPTTRSPTATSTSSRGRRACSTAWWSAWSTSRCASRRRCSRAEEREAFIERRDGRTARQRRGRDLLQPRGRVRPRARRAAIVKGLRAISDFEYEFEMNQLNRKLAPEIESVYIIASPELQLPLLDRRQGDGDLRRRRRGPGPRVACAAALAERLKR